MEITLHLAVSCSNSLCSLNRLASFLHERWFSRSLVEVTVEISSPHLLGVNIQAKDVLLL